MQSKILYLTIAGLVIGAILGVLGVTQNFLLVAVLGGILGFLVGWVWNTRTDTS
jgi:Na+/citrate or Na+/malate symporter